MVELRCDWSDDNGSLQYHWKKGTEIISDNKVTKRGRQLTITNVAVSDSGQYHCEVNVNGKNVPSPKIQVTVKSELLTCS